MNIAVVAPEKFEFQDMACIELALSFRPSGPLTLLPEPQGGEDARLIWNGTSPLTLEVQVKGAKGVAGVAELANHFVHYPDRKASGSLLERLLDDDALHVLFIFTARCDDNLAPLLRSHPLTVCPVARQAPRALAEALRNELSSLATISPAEGASNLDLARLQDLAQLARRPISALERVLAKTSLIDQETAETIEVRLHTALRAERFDTLSIRGILAHLSDLLAKSKRSQADAFAPILDELTKRAPSAVQPDGYVERGVEDEMEMQLRNECVLLIAGPPRAGKSWTARAIGGRLQLDGFEVRQGSRIEEAERFLTDASGAERAYILDDPIGGREVSTDASSRLAALGALAARIPSNRRLVVAQAEHILLQTRATADLAKCALDGRLWRRLEPLTIERAQAIWGAAATAQGIEPAAISRVSVLIVGQQILREPGALAYLAQTWSELPAHPLDDEILFQSRRDASDFARMLATQGDAFRDLLTASALATTSSDGAADAELAFIVNGGADRPGLESDSQVISYGDAPRPPPTYRTRPLLNDAQQHAIDTLQRRRVLESRDNRVNFTHPFLRAGAQTLISPDIPRDRERILSQVERAIACAVPATSLAAARNLRWLRLAMQAPADEAIFALAGLGIRSLFPATRDHCFQFLIEFADQLPEESREQLPYWSEHMLIDLEDIDVEHGGGFISDQRGRFSEVSPLATVRPYLKAIEENASLALDLSLSHRLLLTLNENPEALTHVGVRRFLLADEAVVRAAAARIWCRIPRDDDADIFERLDLDASPSISLALLSELVECWSDLKESRRERILAVLVAHAMSPGCASVLLKRLVVFNRPEYFGDQPPWHVFTTLMPVVIAHLPLSVSFADGRFDTAMDDAARAAAPQDLSPAIEAWAARVLRRLERYMLTEGELAVADLLIQVATEGVRLPILRSLLGVADTGARVATLKWLTARWGALSQVERVLVAQVLGEDRVDARWLAATILTAHEPPEWLVTILTGDPETLTASAEAIEAKLGKTLFSACVHMFVGWPQPLWWYATHHSRNLTWPRVIRYLARAVDHPLHAIAFFEIANFGEKGELAQLISDLPESLLADTFERLLDFKIAHTGDWRREAWQRLFARAEQAGLLDRFIGRIDTHLEGILDSVGDIRYWLGEGDLAGRILRLLPYDVQAIVEARELHDTFTGIQEQLKDPALIDDVFSRLCTHQFTRLEARPPRLHETWCQVGKILEHVGADAETCAAIEKRRREAIDRQHAIGDRFAGSPQLVDLEGWIEQARLIAKSTN